jgi:transposase
MSYLDVVPSEHSSGELRRRGPITKSGRQHARRLLVEAAWHYRRPPRVAVASRAPSSTASPRSSRSRGKRNGDCTNVWQRMQQRNKRRTIIAVEHAVAFAAGRQ